MRKKILLLSKWIIVVIVSLVLVTSSLWIPINQVDYLKRFTRPFEFDYFGWTMEAALSKIAMLGLGVVHHLNDFQQDWIINEYFLAQEEISLLTDEIEAFYSNPDIMDPDEASRVLRERLDQMTEFQSAQALLAEAVIQNQISRVLNEMDLTEYETPFPPVLYRVAQLPKHLVISPRDVIRQEASFSLDESMDITEIEMIEQAVESETDFSALVVSSGGVGTYPSMVLSYSNPTNLIETVAHEWMHNYLTFKPLGIRYDLSTELRTMNETTASIAGKEISQAVMQRFYVDNETKLNPLFDIVAIGFSNSNDHTNQPFDFRKEMYQIRLRVDELLNEGKVDEAEEFMREQRSLFWENGYQIRKLNQAYFAFHGAYADEPFSAAGDDPVGIDVRLLRQRSDSLSQFIRRISRMTSYQELRDYLESY